ncbi:MAG TPA: IS66 family transposase, partial [Polyangiaceae bacterium]|nr:IS66 family transposase [Polyangiaceae bacterium]
LWRKISGGTHSEQGSRFAERGLTVVATLRQQNRNILAFLRAACEARLARTAPPSLLPEPATIRTLARAA